MRKVVSEIIMALRISAVLVAAKNMPSSWKDQTDSKGMNISQGK
jgi:hypothetical protein